MLAATKIKAGEGKGASHTMFPIMSFIIPNISMKPPDIPNIPKGETAPACILRLAGLVAGMLPSVMLRKGLYPKPPDNMRLIC